MFVDYYSVLELNVNATLEEIKTAYKKQALKWHPDRNVGVDTTVRMQLINEAYLILKDIEARQRYDVEYLRYKEHQRQTYQNQEQQKERERQKQTYNAEQQEREKQREKTRQEEQEKRKPFSETFEDDTYEVYDETLNKWMSNAKKQAVNLAKQTIDDIIGMSKASGKAMAEQVLKGVGRLIVFSIIMSLVFKACQ
jgi:curved DNA-binding protein CbpA